MRKQENGIAQKIYEKISDKLKLEIYFCCSRKTEEELKEQACIFRPYTK